MSIWKRAYLYVVRKKARSLLLFLIFFIAALFLLTGISIKRSAGEEAGNFRKTLTTGLEIESYVPDPYSIMEESVNGKGEKVLTYTAPLIREHHIKEFLEIEGVSGFYCYNLQRETAYTGLEPSPGYYTWNLNVADGKIPLEGGEAEEIRGYVKEDRMSYEAGARTSSFIRVYDSEWHPAFVNGAAELVEGRHIRIEDEAKSVISDELAERNGLKVGDKVTAQQADVFSGELYGSVYETEIAGIFHINFAQKVLEDKTFEEDILANTLFCTPDIGDWSRYEYQVQYGYTVSAQEEDDIVCLMVLFLEDPALLEPVKEKLLAMDSIDWDYYKMGVYDKDYQTAAAPLLAMMRISDMLTVLPAAGVLLILSLVLAIWMRSRSYEIGILISIGVKKKTILQQFFIECCSIAAAAFLAAVLLSGPVMKLAGDGLQTMLYAAGDDRGYEVNIEMGTSDMYIDMLPPVKGEALPYAVTLGEACFVFLVLAGTGVVSVLVSSGKMFRAGGGWGIT